MTFQAVVHDSHIRRWRAFSSPKEIIQTQEIAEVKPLLKKIEQLTKSGLWAVGFIAYEASPAFEPSAIVKEDNNFPKLWFALFSESEIIDLPKAEGNFYLGTWQAELDRDSYLNSVSKIKNHIQRGDTYQANFTFRQQAKFQGAPYDCFLALNEKQPTSYAAYINCGDFSICSASPELFFSKQETHIIAKPMKGTAPRSQLSKEDEQISLDLKSSIKERSENIMIVDMIRNDLSRVAVNNSVRPISLFDIEPFETVWQMTSTIEATSTNSIVDILEALFPCASITGAPKCSTMQILAKEERSPRKPYTGCIGIIYPGSSQSAQFSVAIRTLLIDHAKKTADYGVGSGITWDSDPEQEYRECILKSQATPNTSKDLQLLETMLWSHEQGFYLLDLHLQRMSDSAQYFAFPFNHDATIKYLNDHSRSWPQSDQRVRLLLSHDGKLENQIFSFTKSDKPLKITLAKSPVDSNNIYLFHKTTNRAIYNKTLSENPDFDDVLLWNEKKQITESCIANIAFKQDGIWYTPPINCGVLNGVFRKSLIENKTLQEKVLLVDELKDVQELAVINSVRGWVKTVVT